MAEQEIPVKLPDGRTFYMEGDPTERNVQEMKRQLETEGLDPMYERFLKNVGANPFKSKAER